MIKVLFVCYGNICRSPMAEFILKDMVKKKGLEDKFYIASAATGTEEIWGDRGNPVYPPARKELAKHGLSCDGKYAVQLRREDYKKYDYLIGMDSSNIRNMERICGGDPEGKIYRMMSFAGSNHDVADPWYTGDFKTTYNDVVEGCTAFLEYLAEGGLI